MAEQSTQSRLHEGPCGWGGGAWWKEPALQGLVVWVGNFPQNPPEQFQRSVSTRLQTTVKGPSGWGPVATGTWRGRVAPYAWAAGPCSGGTPLTSGGLMAQAHVPPPGAPLQTRSHSREGQQCCRDSRAKEAKPLPPRSSQGLAPQVIITPMGTPINGTRASVCRGLTMCQETC